MRQYASLIIGLIIGLCLSIWAGIFPPWWLPYPPDADRSTLEGWCLLLIMLGLAVVGTRGTATTDHPVRPSLGLDGDGVAGGGTQATEVAADEQLAAIPELALRGMSDEEFERIRDGGLNMFLLQVSGEARERLAARRRAEGTPDTMVRICETDEAEIVELCARLAADHGVKRVWFDFRGYRLSLCGLFPIWDVALGLGLGDDSVVDTDRHSRMLAARFIAACLILHGGFSEPPVLLEDGTLLIRPKRREAAGEPHARGVR